MAREVAGLFMDLHIRPPNEDKSAEIATHTATAAKTKQTLADEDLAERIKNQDVLDAQRDVSVAQEAYNALLRAEGLYSTVRGKLRTLETINNAMTAASQSVLNATKAETDTEHAALNGRLTTAKNDKETAEEQLRALLNSLAAQQAQTTAALAAAQLASKAPLPASLQRFIETSGGFLVREGSKALEAMVEPLLAASPPGGIVFIDEAGQLTSPGGMQVVHRLLKLAEDHRCHLTFMLAGYKDDIDKVLYIIYIIDYVCIIYILHNMNICRYYCLLYHSNTSAMLCYVVLCSALHCYAMLCYAVLCYAILN
jgi:hypothetical protein